MQSMYSKKSEEAREKMLDAELRKMVEVVHKDGSVGVRNQMVISLIECVNGIAKQMCGKGVEQEDLAQEGVLGLIEAIKHYDVMGETPFDRYAMWWVKKYMWRFITLYRGVVNRPLNGNVSIYTMSMPSSLEPIEKASVEEELERQDQIRLIDAALKHIGGQEEQVLRMSYGWECEKKSDEEIATELQLKSEVRVRQIRCKAKKKIREWLA